MTSPGIDRSTKASAVYEALREEILTGRFGPGSPMNEIGLAEAHGISRTPVREALRALHSEGLLKRGGRRQLLVADVSERHRNEITLLRVALEGIAAASACEEHTPDDLDGLELLIIKQVRCAEAGESQEFLRLDEQFHLALAGTARMATLSQLLAQLGAFVTLARIGEPTEITHMLGLIEEHRQLLDFLRARDADELRNALARHIRNIAPRRPGA